jgi:hypothetical protein
MLNFILWSIGFIYIAGFLLVLWMNIASGPVTLGLSLLRAVVWPLYLATGWPHGVVGGMD